MRDRWAAGFLAAVVASGVGAWAQSAPLPPGTSAGDSDGVPAAPKVAAPGSAASGGLAEAEAKLDNKDYAGARTLLAAYVSAHPADARALFDLGYAEDALGDSQAAELSYRKALTADPEQLESHVALGLLLGSQGKQAEAVRELKAAAALKPAPPNPAAQAQGNRALARLLAQTDPAAASEALVAALRQSPETTSDTLLAAEIAQKQGDADASAAAYGRVLQGAPAASPEAAEAAAGLAHLLIAAKRYGEAEPVLRKALMSNPEDPVLQAQLAQVLSAQGKQAEAVTTLEKLHAAHPEDAAIAAALADLYLQTGDPAKAEPVYAALVQQDPHDAGLLASEGDALVRESRFTDAIPVLKEATRLDRSNGNAWSSLAFAANQTHQPQLVLDALAMRSKVMSETPATYFLAATACDSLHLTKRAAELYRQFLSVAGTNFPDETWQARHRLVALAR